MDCPIEGLFNFAGRVWKTLRYYGRQTRLNVKALMLAFRAYRVTRELRSKTAEIERQHAKNTEAVMSSSH